MGLIKFRSSVIPLEFLKDFQENLPCLIQKSYITLMRFSCYKEDILQMLMVSIDEIYIFYEKMIEVKSFETKMALVIILLANFIHGFHQ